MTTLRKSLADYLELRRGMGFKLHYYERRLGRFNRRRWPRCSRWRRG